MEYTQSDGSVIRQFIIDEKLKYFVSTDIFEALEKSGRKEH